MINEIRYRQIRDQIRAINSLGGQQITTYQQRDNVTGQRDLTSADGSTLPTKYLSESVPDNAPLYSAGGFALPGTSFNR
jgi:hypothetical protein